MICASRTDDPPQEVIDAAWSRSRGGLPERHPDETPYAIPLDKARYEINIPLHRRPATGSTCRSALFRTRLWYAARRAGPAPRPRPDRQLRDPRAHAREYCSRLGAAVLPRARRRDRPAPQGVSLERWGEGEVVQRAGTIPEGIRIIVSGAVELSVPASQGSRVPVAQLQRDDVVGLTALTRQVVGADVTAVSDLAVLFIPTAVIDAVVKSRPALARDIGQAIDSRQELGRQGVGHRRREQPRGVGHRLTPSPDPSADPFGRRPVTRRTPPVGSHP